MTTNTVLRCSPRFIELKKKFENNRFGKVYFMEFDYNYGRLNKIIDGWRGKIKNYSVVLGGGDSYDILITLVEKFISTKNQIFSK